MTAMFVHFQLKAERWKSQPVNVVQEKIDGFRLTLYCQPNGRIIARGSDPFIAMEGQLDRYQWFRSLKLPPHTSVDGELIAPGLPASSVSRHLATGGLLDYRPFALPWYKGQLCYVEEVGWAVERLKDMGHWTVPQIQTYMPSWTAEILLQSAQQMCLEGWMLKQFNYAGWYKLKVEKTIDCIVTGIEPGKGKYAGMAGALLVSVFKGGVLTEIASVSGMTDEERSWLGKDSIGRVCEVKYQNVAPRGRLRHPRFIRWRDDKLARDCTWETQI